MTFIPPGKLVAAPRVCLVMIVKNEAPIIRRCLESAKDCISAAIICDTGSSDGTQDIVRRFLRNTPGELHEHTWRDFSFNRNLALDEARRYLNGQGFLLLMDADEVLRGPLGHLDPQVDGYYIEHRFQSQPYFSWSRLSLINARSPYYYRGVIHEGLYYFDDNQNTQALEQIEIVSNSDSARAKDPDKYKKDAKILEDVVARNPNDSRAWFYLAQSYRDAGKHTHAIAAYMTRARMGGWPEEVWFSLYQAGVISRSTELLMRAFDYRPSRAEAPRALVRILRKQGLHDVAKVFEDQADKIPMTADILFVDKSAYSAHSAGEEPQDRDVAGLPVAL